MTPLTNSRALAIAIFTALGSAGSIAVLGRFGGGTSWPDALLAGLVIFAVVYSALRLGRARGMLVVWCVLILSWCAAVLNIAAGDHWNLTSTLRELPNIFGAWSFIALPFFVASVAFTGRGSQRRVAPVVFFWIALLGAALYYAQYAIDVGANPRESPFATWVLGPALALLPLFVGAWRVKRRLPASPQR